MSLPSSMANFVPCDRLLQKAYSSPQQPCAAEVNVTHKPIQSNQVRSSSGPTRTVDLSAHTRAIKSDHPQDQPAQWICQPMQSSQADHWDQPGQRIGQWICQSIQNSQVRPSRPTRTVDLSAHT